MHKITNNAKHLIIILFFAVTIGPLLIHVLFKVDASSWLGAEWTAGDMLQYYGTIVAASIAIYGVYLTFQDNRRAIGEQGRLNKLPYFSLTTLRNSVRNPLLGTTSEKRIDSKGGEVLKPSDKNQEYYYKEEKQKAAIISIREGTASIVTKLSEEDKRLITNGGVTEQRLAPGVIGFTNEHMIYVPIILKNVGNGAALDFRVCFYSREDGSDDRKYVSSTSVDMDEEFYLGFFSVCEKEENVGEYLLEVIYRDIFENQYRQNCKFIISYENEVKVSMETVFKQILIKKSRIL